MAPTTLSISPFHYEARKLKKAQTVLVQFRMHLELFYQKPSDLTEKFGYTCTCRATPEST